VLRANLLSRVVCESPSVYVIPNALLADQFHPTGTPPSTETSEPTISAAKMALLTRWPSITQSRSLLLHVSRIARVLIYLSQLRHEFALLFRKSDSSLVRPFRSRYGHNTDVWTGGDGPKMIELLQMREKHLLQDRIEVLGPVPPRQVRDVRDHCLLFTYTVS